MLALRAGKRVRLITRNGYDWSKRYPSAVEAIAKLKIRRLCVTRIGGVSTFGLCHPCVR
jgi:ATP-dependent DNA ligase